jgi:uncharacterized membrane protein
MLIVAVSSFWVHEIRSWGIWQAHRHCVERHRQAMIGLFCGALLIAGHFTLMPGRIMHKVPFGG